MMPWRNTNEDASSAGNMQMNEPNLKRNRSDSNNCHQCRRNDKGRVVRCTKCNKKGYCIACITKWYAGMHETNFAEACPSCRNICNCTACLQSDVATQVHIKELMIPDLCISDKTQYSKYIIRVLLPFLKNFVVEHNMEKEHEVRIQAVRRSPPGTSSALLHNHQAHHHHHIFFTSAAHNPATPSCTTTILTTTTTSSDPPPTTSNEILRQ